MTITRSHYPDIVRHLSPYFWSLYRQVLDVFIPPRCAVCSKVGTWLCDSCARQIPLFDVSSICPLCGRPGYNLEPCDVCKITPLLVAPVRAVFLFKDDIREVIHGLKYRGAREVAGTLSGRMAEAWQAHHMQSDVLIPVPLYPDREAKRGYNQADVIAKALARVIRVPVMSHAMVRVRDTISQTRLNRHERHKNVEDAFVCVAGSAVAGKQVTLVDDVATTGATLNACAVALLTSGAKSVSAFTLARAP